jgi:tRNA pseudouridine55 synthase
MTQVSMTPRQPPGILQQRLNHPFRTIRVKVNVSVNGILVIDKPVGITSRDAVDGVQRCLPRDVKIGHTGTLDPLASGVLVLCLGHATRLAEFVQMMPKSYEAEFTLGARSATDDAEGPITTSFDVDLPDRTEIEKTLPQFVGVIDQIPPAFSAAKVSGQRAYDVARRGRSATLTPRAIRIDRIEIQEYDAPKLRLAIDCGKGTYIRSLARDLGDKLGCGGYVSALRRTRVGPFTASVAIRSDCRDYSTHLQPTTAAVALLPPLTVTPEDATRVRHGQRIQTTHAYEQEFVALLDSNGELVGIARPVEDRKILQPDRVIPHDE